MSTSGLRIAALVVLMVALAPTASACPTCPVGGGIETLAYVVGFLGFPYVIVMGVLFWVRKVLR